MVGGDWNALAEIATMDVGGSPDSSCSIASVIERVSREPISR
jgi:hypothetical protein